MSSGSRPEEAPQKPAATGKTCWTQGPVLKSVLLAVVFLIALAVSLYRVIHSPVQVRYGLGPFGDSYLFHTVAYNLYEGHGFSATDDGRALGLPHKDEPLTYEPVVVRGPVYPLFVCALYKVFGSRKAMASSDSWHVNWDRVRMVQCVLQAVTSLLVFCIVRAVWVCPFWPALAASFIHAFCFYNVFYTRAFLGESVTTFLLTVSILLGVWALKSNKVSWWLAAGALFGGIILSRAEYILFPFAFGAYILWVNRRQGWIGVRNVMLFGGAALCVMAPWTIRNYCVFHRLVPVSLGGLGPCLYGGTLESKDTWKHWGVYSDDVFYLPGEKERFNALCDAFNRNFIEGGINVQQADQAFTQMAIARIKTRPLACLGNWLAKAPRLWYQNYIPMYQEREASGNWFLFYFVFALLAFWLSRKEEKVLMGLIGLLFGYLNVIFLPLHVEPRFGVALMPGIIALTGIGLGKTCLWIKTKRGF